MQDLRELRALLLAWYRAHRRDLPWRRTSDPYAVWISEVMLQQTRVDTVIPYYRRFLERWPTIGELVDADPSEVQAAWSGLGYYRRLRLMLSAAEVIVRDHGGRLPKDVGALLELPGFGRYTAGAVASIAFGLEAPAVDGNVQRVLARIFGAVAEDEQWRIASALVPGESPGELNQALIELGATVCTPKAPRCSDCPVSKSCVALREDRIAQLPPPRKRATKTKLEVTALLILDAKEKRVVLERQPREGLFADLWLLPSLEGRLERDAILDEAERKYGFAIDRLEMPYAEVTHVLTHREITMRIARALGAISRLRSPLAWHELAKLDSAGIPSMTTRALKASLPKWIARRTKFPGRSTQAKRAASEASEGRQADSLRR